MITPKNTTIFLVTIAIIFCVCVPSSFSKNFNQINRLFAVRDSITEQGNTLPEAIKIAQGNDVRTLERIFELNTSTLTTIEAYFRILMVALSTGNESQPETVEILNSWLEFINNQCTFDIEYLEEAFKETADEVVKGQINTAKNNIQKLSEITKKSIAENNQAAKKANE